MVQALAGSPADVEVMGLKVIRTGFMTEQYRDFFCNLNQFFVATHDAAGRPWCGVVCGRIGFISSPDRSTLVMDMHPMRNAGALRSGRVKALRDVDTILDRRKVVC